MKPYSELTKAEKLLLTGDTFLEAVKIDALTNGITIPISYGEQIRLKQLAPYVTPFGSTRVYEIGSEYNTSGVCFSSEAAALTALQGALFLTSEGWPAKPVLQDGSHLRVRIVDVPLFAGRQIAVNTESPNEKTPDYKPFNELLESHRSDWEKTLQEQSSCERRAVRRQTYLDLAKGNIEIAQGFWRNVEKTNWPNEKGEIE